jgi:hypothetical protein
LHRQTGSKQTTRLSLLSRVLHSPSRPLCLIPVSVGFAFDVLYVSLKLPIACRPVAPLNDSASLAAPTPPTNLLDFTAPSHDFGSEAANLEYAVLSSILDVAGFDASAGLPPSMFDGRSGSNPPPPPAPLSHAQAQAHSQSSSSLEASQRQALPFAVAPQGFAFKPSTKPTASIEPIPTTGMGVMRPEDVYRLVNKPYPYTEAYHHLIRHLKESYVWVLEKKIDGGETQLTRLSTDASRSRTSSASSAP